MGGYESACHINKHGRRLDMIVSNRHDRRAESDYRLLRLAGIHVARDGVRWHLIDQRGSYDLSSFAPQVRAAARAGVQVIWTLCHYGYPDDLDIFSAAFVERFARFSRVIAQYLREQSDAIPLYSPVNEISLYAWAGCRFMFPFAEGRDVDLKRQLIRAAVASAEEILRVDPRARFVQPEPLIHVIAPTNRPDTAGAAAQYNESQYEAMDMLGGFEAPELGGRPRLLDIPGLNYYHSNQWEHMGDRLRWEDKIRDPRWIPLRQLLLQVWRRYRQPLIIGETSHFGAGRARWIEEIATEAMGAIDLGVPLQGICLYPILDRHDWENPKHWHNSGLWDIHHANGSFSRILNGHYARALREAQRRLATQMRSTTPV